MKFMVCYDGTKEAKKALALARDHARVWGASLEVVKVIMRETALSRSFIENAESDLEAEAKTILDDSGVAFETKLLIDTKRPEEQMTRYVREERIDQLFLGIKKTSKVGKLVFGSTAQYMILKAPCPVVTVK